MAVTSSKIVSSEQTFGLDGSTPKRIVYNVTTDTKMSEEAVYSQAQNATPHAIPSLGDWLGNAAYVNEVRVEPWSEYNYRKWRVTVEAGALQDGSGGTGNPGGNPIANPLDRPPVYWIESLSETRIVERDRDGNAIVNTAGQPFDEPITQDVDLTILMCRKYYQTLGIIVGLNKDFQLTQNDAAFQGNEAGTVRYMRTTTGEPVFENNSAYYIGTTSFLVDPDGFTLGVFSRGWSYFDRPKQQAGALLIDGRLDEEQPLTEPVWLDFNGQPYPPNTQKALQTFELFKDESYYRFTLSENAYQQNPNP